MPQLNQSLDSLASLSGSLASTLDGVEPTVEQMKSILNQLNSSLKDSASALGQTKEVLKRVDESLASVQDDLGALQSSQMYQKLTSLEGIDADSIAGFMSSPVSVQSKVLYDVENYGSGMTPFYTNLALWVGGLILVSILKQEVDRDGKIHRFTASQAYFGRWMLFMAVGLVQGSDRVSGRYCASESTMRTPGRIRMCRHLLFLYLCKSDLCAGAYVQAYRKSTGSCTGYFTDPGIGRNISDRDDTCIFPETSSAASFHIWNQCNA